MTAPEPIRIRGIVYPSIAAAARAHNVTRAAVWFARDNGTLENVGLGRSNNNRRWREPFTSMAISLEKKGLTYREIASRLSRKGFYVTKNGVGNKLRRVRYGSGKS